MLNAIELVDLKYSCNLPESRFFDWDDQAKDILIDKWIENMDDQAKEELYDEAHVWFFEVPAPYRNLVPECKSALQEVLEDRLVELVDEVNADDEDDFQGVMF